MWQSALRLDGAKSRVLATVLLVASCFGLAGCAAIEFYAKAAIGQTSLLLARRDAQAVIDDPATDPAVASKLRLVAELLRFAEGHLALPVEGRYRSYVEVEDAAVWMVVAAPEFSVTALPRCYPIIGCAIYRGYFSQRDANQEAARLAPQHDVLVAGSAAYSTLGWFDDPVLSSFIGYDAASLANLIFHELAHSVIYVRDDSVFNESFATFVGVEGAAQWLAASGGDVDAFRAKIRRRRDHSHYLATWRTTLASLYQQPIGDDAKRQLKAEAFAEMRRCYEANRHRLGGRPDEMAALNNAAMALVATYQGAMPAFAQIFREHEGDWIAFYQAVRELGEKGRGSRHAALERLTARAPRRAVYELECA